MYLFKAKVLLEPWLGLHVTGNWDNGEKVPPQVLLGVLPLCMNSYTEPERRGLR